MNGTKIEATLDFSLLSTAIDHLEENNSTIGNSFSVWKDLEKEFLTKVDRVYGSEGSSARDIFSARFNQSVTPLTFLAHFLNPEKENNDLVGVQLQSAFELLDKIAVDKGLDPTESIRMMHVYLIKGDLFGTNFMKVNLNDPIMWWKTVLSPQKYRPLAEIALYVLSIPPTNATIERTFSVQGSIHTDKRNRLTNERMNKLVAIKHNGKLFPEFDFNFQSIPSIPVESIDDPDNESVDSVVMFEDLSDL